MELRSPIRLYWDLTPPPATTPDNNRLCAEIASSRALTVHLTDLGDALSPELDGIIGRLSVSPLELILTISHTALAKASHVHFSGVKKLYIDLQAPETIRAISRSGISGISFRTTRSNHEVLPDIISGCIEAGIAELQLPMERLISGEEPLCLSTDERGRLAARIAKIPFSGCLTVTANDPFLWRLLHPEIPFPEGICQAANTMLSIAPNGDLLPCPAMPIKLGNLQQTAFRDIVNSSLKKEVRGKILTRPSGCMHCRMLVDCRGGCRGRGFYFTATLESADPGCGLRCEMLEE